MNSIDDQKKNLSTEEKIKQLNKVVCICKGIPLKTMLPAIRTSKTVAEVNRKTGSGSGGCKGERCGPRIKLLLKKQQELIDSQKEKKDEKVEPDPKSDDTITFEDESEK